MACSRTEYTRGVLEVVLSLVSLIGGIWLHVLQWTAEVSRQNHMTGSADVSLKWAGAHRLLDQAVNWGLYLSLGLGQLLGFQSGILGAATSGPGTLRRRIGQRQDCHEKWDRKLPQKGLSWEPVALWVTMLQNSKTGQELTILRTFLLSFPNTACFQIRLKWL